MLWPHHSTNQQNDQVSGSAWVQKNKTRHDWQTTIVHKIVCQSPLVLFFWTTRWAEIILEFCHFTHWSGKIPNNLHPPGNVDSQAWERLSEAQEPFGDLQIKDHIKDLKTTKMSQKTFKRSVLRINVFWPLLKPKNMYIFFNLPQNTRKFQKTPILGKTHPRVFFWSPGSFFQPWGPFPQSCPWPATSWCRQPMWGWSGPGHCRG